MRKHELEKRTLDIVSTVKAHKSVEDDLVELKSEWPDDPNWAARRIAGHANIAGGEPILWVIGIDEKAGDITGASHNELANWLPRVEAEFDDLAPALLMHLNVRTDGEVVVALLFETDRAPYVVKNRVHGQPGGGPVAREVPWRVGTSVRTAKRTDLIRLLSPLPELPTIDVLSGRMESSQPGTRPNETYWTLDLELYVKVTGERLITLPIHQCKAEFEIPSFIDRTELEHLEFRRAETGHDEAGMHKGSMTIDASRYELHVGGPGAARLRANTYTPIVKDPAADANVYLSLRPTDSDLSVPVNILLKRVVPRPPNVPRGTTIWRLAG